MTEAEWRYSANAQGDKAITPDGSWYSLQWLVPGKEGLDEEDYLPIDLNRFYLYPYPNKLDLVQSIFVRRACAPALDQMQWLIMCTVVNFSEDATNLLYSQLKCGRLKIAPLKHITHTHSTQALII